MTSIPPFESDFLRGLSEAYQKRRKSLKHRNSRPEIYKVYEQGKNGTIERLEIALEEGARSNGAVLRLNAWPDRYISVNARKLEKTGIVWNWSYDGRLLGQYSGRGTIAALEETYNLLHHMDLAQIESLNKPWRPLLARGPSEFHPSSSDNR